MNSSFSQFLFLFMRIPYFLVVIAGLVLALTWWRRMPMVALWATLGFSCLLASTVGSFAMFPAMQVLSNLLGLRSASSPQNVALIMGVCTSLLSTAGLAMLTVAIFGWRQSNAAPR